MSENLRDLALDVAEALLQLRQCEQDYRDRAADVPPGHPWRRSAARRVAARSSELGRALDLYEQAKLRAGEQS